MAQSRPAAGTTGASGNTIDRVAREGVSAAQDELSHLNARRVAIVAALWLLGAVALALLSVAAHTHNEFPGDVGFGLAVAIQKLRGLPVITGFINFASDANWPKPAGIFAIAVVGLLALSRHVRAPICTAIAAYGADFANATLNGAVARPRPNNIQIHAVAHLGLHSFPSGHVIAFYGILFYLSIVALHRHPGWAPWLRASSRSSAYTS
jgi:hypothetical protein